MNRSAIQRRMAQTMGAVIACACLIGCGAFGDVSVPVAEVPTCPSLDDRLSKVTKLIEEGKLQGLKSVMEDDISADIRTRTVELLLAIAKTLPLEALDGVMALGDQVDSSLTGVVSDLLESIISIGEPAYEAVGTVGSLMDNCTGKPLLQTLIELLADEGFRVDIQIVIETNSLGQLMEILGFDFSKLEKREGFIAFLQGLLTGISQPSFEIATLTGPDGLFGGLATSDNESFKALFRVFDQLLAAGKPVDSVQLVTSCLLETDPDSKLFGLVFDILHATTKLELPAPATEGQGQPIEFTTTLDQVVLPLLSLLADDDSVRGALVAVVSAMTRPTVVAKVLPDVLTLFQEGAVDDIIGLALALLKGEC